MERVALDKAFAALGILAVSPLLCPGCTSRSSGVVPNSSANHGGGGSNTIQISWNANHEAAVNKAGGGYRVYYSTSSPVNTATGSYVAVPYVSGPSAPTSATLSGLADGTYHFRVVALSALNPPGGSAGSVSADSSEVSVTVP